MKYRAKIADFGTSRSVAIDQTHLKTLVYGTFGYLDPEYFQSSQFTVVKEGERKETLAFAHLAERCLNLNAKRQPTMKEVADVLEDIRKSLKSSNGQVNFEEIEFGRDEVIDQPLVVLSSSTWSSSHCTGTPSSSDGIPLLSPKIQLVELSPLQILHMSMDHYCYYYFRRHLDR
ncbi:hypothetical protein TIFTF001_012210 [Ficus carica]|uniref:Uncharacterized protein n=1 Tax=Ficus carica TaxID=3494 RepID=A0AA88D3H7_FICCA|nr:hypothetical protein TIFTF001_012210 [Ficus carica]